MSSQPDSTVPSIEEVLGVQRLDDDVFGVSGASVLQRMTMFGGALLGQSLLAAAGTVGEDYAPNHLHCEFLRAGRAGEPITFHVDRVKDGRTISNRRVVGRQGTRAILALDTSFRRTAQVSPEYQIDVATDFPSAELAAGTARIDSDPLGLQVIDPRRSGAAAVVDYRAWFRATRPLPPGSVWDACVLAIASDMGVPTAAFTAAGIDPGGPDGEGGGVSTTSVNHTMWFHRPCDCQEWFLVTARPLSTAFGSGVSLGAAYDRDGHQVASIVQEMVTK